MSTNSECQILEVAKGKWFYILEDRHAPKGAWDWREHARGYGPFDSEEKAEGHLRDNHPNPGGHWTEPLPEGVTERDMSDDQVLKDLIAAAPNNTRRSRW